MSRASPYRFRLSLAVLLMLLIGPSWGNRLSADPLPLTLISNLAGTEVTVTYAAPAPDYPGGFTLTGFAGQMLLQRGTGGEFIGFCVDLAHFVGVGQTFLANSYLTDSPTNGLTNGGQVAFLANAYGGQPLSNVEGAGLQIAIWSELYDNGTGFNSGIFQYTAAENANDPNYSAIAAAATTYLTAAQGQFSLATWYDASPSGPGQWRGQSVVDPAAPAPPSMVLFLLGLGGLGIASGWRRRLLFV